MIDKKLCAALIMLSLTAVLAVGNVVLLSAVDQCKNEFPVVYDQGFYDGNLTGYASGEVVGYETGYTEGNSTGYVLGFNVGQQDGYTSGVAEGIEIGEASGYNEGHSVGYDEGFIEGQTEGYTKGRDIGFVEGNNTGYTLGFNVGQQEGYATGVIDGVGTGYNIRDPTYTEMLAFLEADQTDKNEYTEQYQCWNFVADVKQNAYDLGYRCGFVYIEFPYSAHAIVCFDTVDQGLVFVESQWDDIVQLTIGEYYSDSNGFVPTTWNDTIMQYAIIW